MIRAVVLTPYQRVTDGQTDEIAIAITALAKRRAVKIARPNFTKLSVHVTCGRGSEVACDRRTDRRTERIAVASTALAMRALRRAVKTNCRLIFCTG